MTKQYQQLMDSWWLWVLSLSKEEVLTPSHVSWSRRLDFVSMACVSCQPPLFMLKRITGNLWIQELLDAVWLEEELSPVVLGWPLLSLAQRQGEQL